MKRQQISTLSGKVLQKKIGLFGEEIVVNFTKKDFKEQKQENQKKIVNI